MLGRGRPPWLIVNEKWGIAVLLFDLAELLFQFGRQRFKSLPRQRRRLFWLTAGL
jgi:ABC-type uncharacterized transport system permease subunit